MSDSNVVEMSIPYNNPFFDWVMRQRGFNKSIPYVTLSVDGIEARLALVEVPGIHRSSHDETYLTTKWVLLRSKP